MTGTEQATERAADLRAQNTPPPEARALLIMTLVIGALFLWGAYKAFPVLFDWVKGVVP